MDRYRQLEPVDPIGMLESPAVAFGRCSRDGKLIMLEYRNSGGDIYLPPMAGHLVSLLVGPAIEIETWTSTGGPHSGVHQEGRVMLVPAGETAFIGTGTPHSVLLLLIRPSAWLDIAGAGAVVGRTASGAGRLRSCIGREDPLMRCIVEGLAAEIRSAPGGGSDLLDCATAALGAHLSAAYADVPASKDCVLRPQQLERVFDHVQKNLQHPIRLEALARLTGYSPSHFSRLFKTATGQSPMRYVQQCRMSAARDSIATSRASLTEIASGLGFADLGHFSRTFKDHWQVTPSSLARPDR